jgi:hypothetical protein
MSQLDLLRDVWGACSEDEREQFMQLLIKDPPEPVEVQEEEEAQELEAQEVVEPEQEETPEPCALCLSDISDDPVNPYECIHEFCSGCYDTNKTHECMKTCPMCRAVLTHPLEPDESFLNRALKQYIIIWNRHRSARSKRICVVKDILFDNVDILPQFHLISTAPINFMTRSRGITAPDGGTQWVSGIYTLTQIIASAGEGPFYIQRYMFVNRRSDTYIKYCVLFETSDLIFQGRHLKDVVHATGGNSEYFNGNTPSSPVFIRRNWTKVCDIDISICPEEYEQFLAVPSTIKSDIDFQVGYTELENYFRDEHLAQLHGMIALYISMAHDLLIYEACRRQNNRIPYTFLCFQKYCPDSQGERIFLKPYDIEIPIHNILRSRLP